MKRFGQGARAIFDGLTRGWEKMAFNVQEIMAFMLLTAGVVTLAIRRWRTRRGLAVAALIALMVSLGVCVWLEFALDRTAVNKYLIYAVYIVALAAPVCLGVLLRREDKA